MLLLLNWHRRRSSLPKHRLYNQLRPSETWLCLSQVLWDSGKLSISPGLPYLHKWDGNAPSYFSLELLAQCLVDCVLRHGTACDSPALLTEAQERTTLSLCLQLLGKWRGCRMYGVFTETKQGQSWLAGGNECHIVHSRW